MGGFTNSRVPTPHLVATNGSYKTYLAPSCVLIRICTCILNIDVSIFNSTGVPCSYTRWPSQTGSRSKRNDLTRAPVGFPRIEKTNSTVGCVVHYCKCTMALPKRRSGTFQSFTNKERWICSRKEYSFYFMQ